MFIELIDSLRCPNDHEESWLVASIAERAGRDIVTGILGCPVCRAEYPIAGGIAVFADREPASPPPSGPYDERDDDAAVRCAALLDLYDPGGFVVLTGSWLRVAGPLLDLTEVAMLVVDPTDDVPLGERISGMRIGETFPLACGVARGIALGGAEASAALIESAARALRPKGRLLAPVSSAVPAGIVERARDDRFWLGEAEPVSEPVRMTVKRPG